MKPEMIKKTTKVKKN